MTTPHSDAPVRTPKGKSTPVAPGVSKTIRKAGSVTVPKPETKADTPAEEPEGKEGPGNGIDTP